MMWSDNQLTRKLKIQYPIIQAGMAGSTTPQLVAAVSESGGLGSIGAGYYTAQQLLEDITQVRQLTKKPFAVNIFVPSQQSTTNNQIEHMNAWLKPYRRALKLEEPVININERQTFERAIDIIIDQQIKVCSFTFGIPNTDTIKRLKNAGITVIGTATSVDEAIANERAGIDIIVAQGSEAGGHRGSFLKLGPKEHEAMIGTMSLVPQIVDAVTVPVIAAGGIMDGRGVLASLVLGASGVQMGTAFLTSSDSKASPLLRESIINSKETDTVVTKTFSGKYARGINNQFIEDMQQYPDIIPEYPIQNQLTNLIRKEAAKRGNKELTHMWSGQSPRLATTLNASALMSKIVNQIDTLLSGV